MPSSKSSIDKRDVYYRKGKSAGYRARSAWKLLHLDEDFDLFSGVDTAVDLCAAPGSWSQVLGQKLKPTKGDREGKKVVSVDLQPMAPLPNITILQTDITLPSTIPLVLRALGGRQADLVVCDGAPDVTGVHDLDAYLHSQLLLAALTLSLTLLAPHGTLIFKIFLSPLDPKAAMLRSQLQPFFPGPPTHDFYGEFDEPALAPDLDTPSPSRPQRGEPSSPRVGHDLLGRRGGVWVRKPRSSRKGSGEAFLVCRNFDRSKVPLPMSFSEAALNVLASQKGGTLTLDSLASLCGQASASKEWEMIKAYVGSGDLNAMPLDLTALNGSAKTSGPPMNASQARCSHTAIQASNFHLTPPRLGLPNISVVNGHDLPGDASRQSSLDSFSPTSPSNSAGHPNRPWDRSFTPLPSPGLYYTGPTEGMLASPTSTDGFLSSGPSSARPGLTFEDQLRPTTPVADGAVSPTLSTSSRNDLFFSGSKLDSLPAPPKPLASATLGNGIPSHVTTAHGRSASSPVPPKAIDLLSPPSTSSSRPENLDAISSQSSLPRIAEDPVSKDRVFAVDKALPAVPQNLRFRRFTGTSIPSEEITALPSEPNSLQRAAPPARPDLHQRRSSHIEREQPEGSFVTALHAGQLIAPAAPGSSRKTYKLENAMGQGAFSSVWSASPVESDGSTTSKSSKGKVAVKMMDKRLCEQNARTRISFLREVEVLRHISHPNIVSYLDSFSTDTHHCLVLERMTGGELFELVSEEENRLRMLLPPPAGEPGADGDGFLRRVFGEICKGVGWLHEVGVVHRDLKLENILFTLNPFGLPATSTNSIPLHLLPTPLVKITDFGLARFIDPAHPLLETRCGSESFAAPEIIMGKPYDGRRTDAWALGVILYALVVGELPFDDPPLSTPSSSPGVRVTRTEREERKRKMMRIAKADYRFPGHASVSEGCRGVIGSLLVRDPARRATVAQVWESDWMNGYGGVVRRHSHSHSHSHSHHHGDHQEEGEAPRDGRKVLDGFLVDGDGIDDVARSEES